MATEKLDLDFQVGDMVRLLGDHPDDELKAGDAGYVWCASGPWPCYCYEADFYRADGTGTGMMFNPWEVELIADAKTVNIPDEVHEFWRRETKRRSASYGVVESLTEAGTQEEVFTSTE